MKSKFPVGQLPQNLILSLVLATFSLGAGQAVAASFSLSATDGGGSSSFTSPLSGAGATGWPGPASAGNTYSVGGGATAIWLRGPTSGSFTFAGDSLTLLTNGRLLFKTAAGNAQTLTANNLVLNGGVVDLANSGGSGSAATLAGVISLGANSGSGGIGALTGETFTVSSQIGGSGLLVIGGPGVNAGADTGTVILTGSNNNTGGVDIRSGTVTLGAGGTLGADAGVLTVGNSNTGAGSTVTLNLAISADVTTGSLSGAVSTPSSGSNTARIVTQAARTFTVNQTTAGTYAGGITGSGSFILGSLSTNTLILSGTNSYTGTTTVNKGTLQIGNGGTTGSLSGSSAITNNSSLVFNRSNTVTQGTDFGVIGGTGDVLNQVGSGNLVLNASNTFTSQVAVFGGGSITASTLNSVVGGSTSSNLGAPTTAERGTIIMGGNGASGTLIYNGAGETSDRAFRLQAASGGSNGVIDQSGTGLLNLTGGITSVNSASHVLALRGSSSGTGEISGLITNGSGLAVTKAGTGTWTLSGANTYVGATTVLTGKLSLGAGGSIASSSTIDVRSGAILDTTAQSGWTLSSGQTLVGTGTVDIGPANTLTIGGGAFLAPGASPGTTDVTGSLSFAAGSTFTAEISPTTSASDRVNVGGALVIDPSAALALTLFGSDTVLPDGAKFLLVNYSTPWDGMSEFSGYADDSNIAFGLNTYRVDYNDPSLGDTALTLTVVPEPAAIFLAGLGMITFLQRRRDS